MYRHTPLPDVRTHVGPWRRSIVGLLSAAAVVAAPHVAAAQSPAPAAASLKRLSVDDLVNLEITSVSRRSERLFEAPASVYVISAEDIRRSGATTLP